MSFSFLQCLLSIILILNTAKFSFSSSSTSSLKISSEYIFPCYYVYEPQTLKPESIPFDLCTHIINIGCVIDNVNETVVSVSLQPYNCSSVLRKLVSLKDLNPHLKIVISIATNVQVMNKVVETESTMKQYAESAIGVALEYNLDGIDFDWEYPCGEQRLKFTNLLRVFREHIENQQINLLLSAAIGAGINTIKECFDLDGLVNYLDYINVMCYDYNTIWNTYTAYGSPLFARPEEIGYDATLNSNFTINYLIENNVPRKKIVLGLNAGGHTFQLADPVNKHDFHAPVLGVGYASGWSLYPQLCELIKENKGGVAVYDSIAHVLYAYYDDQWANTGDVKSATVKAIWAKQMGLAGVFTWCLNWDDLLNVCGHNMTFPIHRAIREQLLS
jgi:chitinase